MKTILVLIVCSLVALQTIETNGRDLSSNMELASVLTSPSANGECLYNIKSKTANIPFAGTDATLTFQLKSADNKTATLKVNTSLGFERNSISEFRSYAECVKDPCRLIISSDGSGEAPDWICEYVEFTATGDDTFGGKFDVNKRITQSKLADINRCGNGAAA